MTRIALHIFPQIHLGAFITTSFEDLYHHHQQKNEEGKKEAAVWEAEINLPT